MKKLVNSLTSLLLCSGLMTTNITLSLQAKPEDSSIQAQIQSNSQYFTTTTAGINLGEPDVHETNLGNEVIARNTFYTVTGTLAKGAVAGNSGYCISLVTVPDANGTYPSGYAIYNQGGNTAIDQASTNLDSSKPGTIVADLEKYPYLTIVLIYARNSGSIMSGFSTNYVTLDFSGVTLEGMNQSAVTGVVNGQGVSADLSITPVQSASYQWQYADITTGSSPFLQSVLSEFKDISGATQYTYQTTGNESQVMANTGHLYRCKITDVSGTSYSKPIVLPFINSFLDNETTGKIELSQFTKIIDNSSDSAVQSNALLKALGFKLKYYTEAGGCVFYNNPQAQSQMVETAAPAVPADLSQMAKIGSYSLNCVINQTGIYSSAYKLMTLDVVADGTLGTPDDLPDTPAPGYPVNYDDVPAGQWYTSFIQQATDLGLMSGNGKGQFFPFNNLKRGDLALILYRLAKEPEPFATNSFKDVNPSQYYYKAIMWAADNGIVTGYTTGANAGNFMPDLEVDRKDLVTMLGRYAQNIAGVDIDQGGANLKVYPDYGSVSPYALPSFAWAVQNQILNGKLINGTYFLDPNATATRAEAAKMLVGFSGALTAA